MHDQELTLDTPDPDEPGVSRWRKALVAGVAGLSIAGGSVAVAALSPVGVAGAQDDVPSDTSEADVATDERPERGEHFDSILQSLVDDGTITEAQRSTITERFEQAREERRAAFGERGGLGDRGRQGRGDRFSFDVVAEVTGLTAEEIRDGLRDGQSLGELAGDDADELAAALVTQAEERVDEALDSGRIDEERADEIRANIDERVDEMLAAEPGERGRFGRGGHHGPSADDSAESDGEVIES